MMASGIKSLFDKGVASVTVKSSTFLETSKLSNQINNLEAEIPRQKNLMGEAAYKAWQEGSSADEVIAPFCNEIKSLEEQIAELQEKIVAIKEESAKALGENTVQTTVSAAPAGEAVCQSCGASNVADAKFCSKCGSKIE